jgi:hypothetical protein
VGRNTNDLHDQMRAVDDTEVSADIDELVIGATRQGRPRGRRRVLTALSGAAVVCAAGLTVTLAVDDGPAPESPTSSSAMTHKQLQILEVITTKLPGDVEVTAHHGMGELSDVAIAISDSQGLTWVDARIGTLGEDGWDPCRGTDSCSIERVKDGTLYTLEELETGGNSTHYSASYTYERADGRYVYFVQSNVFDPAGRRSSLPLTDEQVRDMLLAPEWDALLTDCRPDPGPNC